MNRLIFGIWLCFFIAIWQNLNLFTQVEQDIMAITKSTFDFITHFEGKRNTAYKDSKGLWTVGVGHLIKPDEQWMIHTTLTDDQVEDLFKSDLRWCDEAVNESVIPNLSQASLNALYSLCFNIGADHFKQSEVVQHINKNEYQKAADAFLNWSKPAVLKSRREQERAMFLSGI